MYFTPSLLIFLLLFEYFFLSDPVAMLNRLDLKTLEWQRLDPTGDAPIGRYKQGIAKDTNR